MSEATTAMEQEEGYRDLLEFLSHQKADVQEGACQAVLELSEDSAFLEYVQKEPKRLTRPLIRLAEREDNVPLQSRALQALVNFTTVPTILESLEQLQGCRRVCEVMKSLWTNGIDKDAVELCIMVLVNLTRCEKGQKALVALESSLALFVSLYLSPPIERHDMFFYLGSVLKNCTAIREGREALCELRVVNPLVKQLLARHRRPDVLSIFRHFAGDPECHAVLAESALLPRMQCFLYPDASEKPEHCTLHPLVAQERTGLTSDQGERYTAAEFFFVFTRSKAGREAMRRDCLYEVLRAWHLVETQEEVKEIIEEVVNVILFSEDELRDRPNSDLLQLAGSPSTAAPAEGETEGEEERETEIAVEAGR